LLTPVKAGHQSQIIQKLGKLPHEVKNG